MEIQPYASGCGVVVGGVQLSELTDAELAGVRAAFVDHGLLFFRDQTLTPDQHLDVAKRYGDIVVNKFFATTDTHPEIAEVRKEPGQEMNIGGGWHADHSYDDEPALGSMLVARELPSAGGDTRFANLYNAFDAFSPGFQAMLESLRAVHSNRHIYGEGGIYRTTDLADQLGGIDRVGDAVHPVVIRHPESGRKALYVNPGHTIGIEGWSDTESRALLRFLYKHVDQPEFTCDFRWAPGSVAFWDNRCTWHEANNDYQGERRLMHRITIAGGALAAA